MRDNNNSNVLVYSLVILYFILGISAIPDSWITQPSFKIKTDLFLTGVIGFFAIIEAWSTLQQTQDNRLLVSQSKLNRELEKVYGVLYSIILYKARARIRSGELRCSQLSKL